MKAYGHSRRDKLECKYGCCTGDSGRKRGCRKVNDRKHRKEARAMLKDDIKAGIENTVLHLDDKE
jgi:hypothetical protein